MGPLRWDHKDSWPPLPGGHAGREHLSSALTEEGSAPGGDGEGGGPSRGKLCKDTDIRKHRVF